MSVIVEVASSTYWERDAYLKHGIDPSTMTGLEIGALDHPIFRPEETRVKFVDYARTDELRQISYAANRDAIVEVDYVWTGSGSLADVVGGRERFDWAIASHVIEHIPNVLGWLRGIGEVLRPGGRFNLALPDRRFTFDLGRQETTLAEWIEADLLDFTRPSIRQVFDHSYHARHVRAGEPWTGSRQPEDYARMSGPDALRHAYNEARDAMKGRFIDSHCSVFTPLTFMELYAGAAELGLIEFYIDRILLTPVGNDTGSGFEFFVNLIKPDGLSQEGVVWQARAMRDKVKALAREHALMGSR